MMIFIEMLVVYLLIWAVWGGFLAYRGETFEEAMILGGLWPFFFLLAPVAFVISKAGELRKR